MTCQNIVLTGPAGTGKSEQIKALYDNHRHKKITILAPTNFVVNSYGKDRAAMTVHRFFGLQPHDEWMDADVVIGRISKKHDDKQERSFILQRVRSLKVLVVDEAMMVHGGLFILMDLILRIAKGNNLPFGGIQLILAGDPYQLSPVHDPPTTSGTSGTIDRPPPPLYWFETDSYKALSTVVVVLSKQHRFKNASGAFVQLINEARRGGPISVESLQYVQNMLERDPDPNAVVLVPTHEKAFNINARYYTAIFVLTHSTVIVAACSRASAWISPLSMSSCTRSLRRRPTTAISSSIVNFFFYLTQAFIQKYIGQTAPRRPRFRGAGHAHRRIYLDR